MTRIRYALNESGVLVSKPMLAGQDLIVVNINPQSKMYTVTSVNTGNVLAQSKMYTNLTSVKLAAKNCVKLMGVVFDDEIRRKQTNE